MPLISTKLHVLNPVWRKKKPRDNEQHEEPEPKPAFIVPETQEICTSAEELQRKITIYNENIWTCRVTGKPNLTYREALKTEATAIRTLKKCFPKFFEKTILERVHLSTLPLESLVHSCWTTIHEQFHIAEPVKLKVDSVSNAPIRGIIDDIIKSQTVPTPVPDNTSPNNSDKENVTKKNSPIKKKYAYNVKVLSDIPVVVHDVPACSIDRINRAPSKDHIKMFIRSHAMRYGPNFTGPWIVNEELLRRHKIPLKSPGCQVDKVKLKQMSKALEEEYFVRVMNSRRQSNGEGMSDDVTSSTPLNFKRIKRFSVLREDNTSKMLEENEDNLPLAQLKDRSQPKQSLEDSGKKKMKQSTLFQFGKKTPTKDEISDKSTINRPKKNTNERSALPRVAQHLIKMFGENRNNPAIETQIRLCAKFISDIDILKLPVELRDPVRSKKEAFAFKKKLLAMSPTQRKQALQEMREKQKIERIQANKLLDDQHLMTSLPQCPRLPEPSKLELPPSFNESLFGRLLGLTEFFHIFHSLLVEGSVDDTEVENPSENNVLSGFCRFPVESPVAGVGEPGYSDDDDSGNTDEEEEEAGLTESNAPLPKICIKSLRRLGLKRLLNAITTNNPSAGAYRSLARPLSVLLRLVLRDEQIGKKRELGLKLSKFPVTPYTAPELLRLTLLNEIPSNHARTTVLEQLQNHAVPVADPNNSSVTQLIHQLSKSDLHELFPEIRVIALEWAVDKIFDLDLIDDHIMACQRRAADAWQRKIQVLRDKNLRKKDKKDNANEANKTTNNNNLSNNISANQLDESKSKTDTPTTTAEDITENENDLASIVKRRRILAARAVIEREEKENLERQRRLEMAQEHAEERAINTVSRLYDIRSTEAKCVLRNNPIGYDRYYRRVWYFRCSPDRLFLEANWASSGIMYSVDSFKKNLARFLFVENESVPITTLSDETIPQPAHTFVKNDTLNGNTISSSWSNWYFYDRPEQLDELLNSLLTRGVRESHLKSQLLADGFLESLKKRWKSGLSNGLVPKADTTNGTPGNIEKRPSHHKRNLPAGAALAGALLKNILDTEVRLRSGGLGGVPDFTKWQERLAQVQTSYESQQETPNVNLSSKPNLSSSPSLCELPNKAGLVNALIEVAENIIPRFLNVPDLCTKSNFNSNQNETDDCHNIKNSFPDHAPFTRFSSGEESDASESNDRSQELEKAVLDPEAHELRTRAWITAWRTEVQNARTLTRLNLLHACLDACVRWEKSVEDARCRICRRKTDDDNLLLCDGCNLAFHLYCLRPPLKRVPTGDWFCPTCGPASRALEKRKREERLARSARRRKRALSSDDEEQLNSDNNEESSGESEVAQKVKRRNPRSSRSKGGNDSSAFNRKRSVSPANRNSASSRNIRHDTSCLVCSDSTGDIVLCSNCPNIFHLDCHDPPLHHIPRGYGWQCSICRSNKKRSTITSYFQSREYRRKTYQAIFKKRAVSPDERSEDEFLNSTSFTRSTRNRNGSRRNVAIFDTDDEQQSSEASSDVDIRPNNQCPISRRRSASRSASALSSQLNKYPKRRRRHLSDQEDTSETEQMDEKSQSLCSHILDAVYKHKHSWPFRKPVDRSQVPDYYEIITDPIDLSMMRDWLSKGRYNTETTSAGLKKLVHDLGTMFYNAELYNAADSDIWLAGEQLENFVKSQFAHINTEHIKSFYSFLLF
ncbi:zinc finger protein, putative [Schistosoma mansoni]|uniref:zinc finger protein, putative n=1 Tax=Schistosoma mansoni TaxID=6183 RepID=UPI00022C8154|nr:zinc finger protein, putative [Schistosoma mansoni]|eukprot:XP_018646310.1 zinc finger protein, putative [Schistosoma mansoni]